MTVALSGSKIAKQLGKKFPGAVIKAGADSLLLKGESLLAVAEYLKTTPDLDFDFLNYITAVDYYDYFEVVYQFTSLKHNHGLVLKTPPCPRWSASGVAPTFRKGKSTTCSASALRATPT